MEKKDQLEKQAEMARHTEPNQAVVLGIFILTLLALSASALKLLWHEPRQTVVEQPFFGSTPIALASTTPPVAMATHVPLPASGWAALSKHGGVSTSTALSPPLTATPTNTPPPTITLTPSTSPTPSRTLRAPTATPLPRGARTLTPKATSR
jgi:hypothetical protein